MQITIKLTCNVFMSSNNFSEKPSFYIHKNFEAINLIQKANLIENLLKKPI